MKIRSLFVVCLFGLFLSGAAFGQTLGDFDGVSGIGVNDYVFLKAYIQLAGGGNTNPTAAELVASARGIRPTISDSTTGVVIPSAANANFDGVTGIGVNDYVFLKAYIQLAGGGNTNPTAAELVASARGIRPTIADSTTGVLVPGTSGGTTGTGTGTGTTTGTGTGTQVTIDFQTQE